MFAGELFGGQRSSLGFRQITEVSRVSPPVVTAESGRPVVLPSLAYLLGHRLLTKNEVFDTTFTLSHVVSVMSNVSCPCILG